MAQIFISYRRTDAGGHAGRLHTLLLSHYSGDDVFFDVAGIEDGRNWEAEIKQHLGKCEVLLVVIGQDWLSARDPESHQRRIDQPGDWVRLEVEAGLEMNKEVIPVLVGGAQLPARKASKGNPAQRYRIGRAPACRATEETFSEIRA